MKRWEPSEAALAMGRAKAGPFLELLQQLDETMVAFTREHGEAMFAQHELGGALVFAAVERALRHGAPSLDLLHAMLDAAAVSLYQGATQPGIPPGTQ